MDGRIAVIADIHGNLLALEAVLRDLERRGGADRLVNLGDIVSGPLWPRETLERLEGLGAVTLRGNHDRWVATQAPEAMGPSDRIAHDALLPAQRAALGALPLRHLAAPGVLAFHASPEDDNAYLLEEVREGRLVRAAPEAIRLRLGPLDPAVRLVLCAHSHRARLLRLPTGPLILNPGSVGCPAYDDPDPPAHVSEAGSPLARYALVEPDGAAALLAVPYDHEEAARQAERLGRPAWARALRTGFMAPA
ncbi:metallophosphoesterase [Roseomonas sp. OT10]|uniref:metallophosphoesterase family protein n=1 Tax=Roseomonas cutis TaxID=2897332 RepID=UPI001E402C37|nr:metallophosphoesterase family protein [Roseomonas sp. OT10]UFN50789.1 metallophosphoesterase [Roseomonas sp. OT10]